MVYTDFRPTPLQHYVFPAHGDGLYMVVDEKSTFKEDTFQKAVAALSEGADQAAAKKQAKGKNGNQTMGEADSDIFKIVRMIMDRQYDPVSSILPPDHLEELSAGLEFRIDDVRHLFKRLPWLRSLAIEAWARHP